VRQGPRNAPRVRVPASRAKCCGAARVVDHSAASRDRLVSQHLAVVDSSGLSSPPTAPPLRKVIAERRRPPNAPALGSRPE
jgi:hypothetical protein